MFGHNKVNPLTHAKVDESQSWVKVCTEGTAGGRASRSKHFLGLMTFHVPTLKQVHSPFVI